MQAGVSMTDAVNRSVSFRKNEVQPPPTQQLAGETSRANADAPVQRVLTQILLGESPNIIIDIAIIGRPENTFSGTSGDHITAYTTIQTGIENMLRGKTVGEASVLLAKLTHQLYSLPGMELRETLPEVHAERLTWALDQLHNIIDMFRSWRKENARLQKEGLPPQGQSNELVGWFQALVDAYLVARELVPLTTIKTKEINEPKAGKGKGESARALEAFEKGENVDDDLLIQTIIGLFDARAAALAIMAHPGQLDRVVPGLTDEFDDGSVFDMMATQHIFTLHSLYPRAIERLKSGGKMDLIKQSLWYMVGQHMGEVYQPDELDENETGETKKKIKRSGVKKGTKRYVGTSIIVEGGIIVDMKIEGRSKSPFSGTMGAHTTAWIVLKDRIWTQLVGKNLSGAAAQLLQIGLEAEQYFVDMAKVMDADTKQMQALIQAFAHVGLMEEHLKKFAKENDQMDVDDQEEAPSDWDKVLILQEGIVAILNLMNLLPGASLDVANTNGNREGYNRAVLLEYTLYPVDEVRQAIKDMLDYKGLGHHMETIGKTVDEEGWSLWKKEYLKMLGLTDEPTRNREEAEALIKDHHFDLIHDAYPGALEYAGLQEFVPTEDTKDDTGEQQLDIQGEVYFELRESVRQFIIDNGYVTNKKIFVVSGSHWACYVRCVLYYLNKIGDYDNVLAQLSNNSIDISSGVSIGSDQEAQVIQVIKHQTGQRFYVEATDVSNGHIDTSAITNGTKVSIILTGAHFSLLY